jgi:predicted transcriptional regulator
VYLPPDLKAEVKRVAAARHTSEANVIRAAIEREVSAARPRPRGGLYAGTESIAGRVDELLGGFGVR